LTELSESETTTETETEITTDNESSSSSKNFLQVQQSKDSLIDLSLHLSDLTLAPARPQRGQFDYRSEDELYSLSPTTFSTSTLSPLPSTLSCSSSESHSFWDHLPQYNTPQTSPAPIPIPANSSDNEDMPQPIFFYSDGHSNDLVPGDYLKTIVNTFKETSATSFKVQRLENGLATNSVAKQWFDNLPAATKLNWDLVEAAFKVRWPKEVLIAETTEKRRWKLRSEKLLKEDIGMTVMANGVEMSGQAHWVGKIQTLAAQADDPSSTLIHSVWNEMPQLIKKLIKSTYSAWPKFTQAVKDVSEEGIETVGEEEGRIMMLKWDAKTDHSSVSTSFSGLYPLLTGHRT
jgi:hypothetical protein